MNGEEKLRRTNRLHDQDPEMWQDWKQQWVRRTEIDWHCYTQIFKGAIAATIALASCQTAAWVDLLGSLSFIVPVAAVICYPMQDRAQFMHALLLNTLAVCLTSAFTALAMFSVVKARSGTSTYDGSACVVASAWLVVLTFALNVARVEHKSMVWPVAAALIVSDYGLVYAPGFTTTQEAMTFLLQLLYCHLLGFAISLGVAFLLFPTTARTSFSRVMSQCASAAISTLRANCALRKALEDGDAGPLQVKIAEFRQKASVLVALQVQLVGAEAAAKQEFSLRGSNAQRLEEESCRMRDILTPLIGMSHLADVAEMILIGPPASEGFAETSAEFLLASLKAVETPFDQACMAASGGIELTMQHIGIWENDTTRRRDTDYNDDRIANIQESLDLLVKSKRTLAAPSLQLSGDVAANESHKALRADQEGRMEIFAVLHGEFLIWTTTNQVLKWLRATRDSPARFNHNRPWYQVTLMDVLEILHDLRQRSLTSVQRASRLVKEFFTSPKKTARRNETVLQQSKGLIELHPIFRFFASPSAGFGLRVAAATMSIAVVSMLRNTRAFFMKQHMIWAVYAVSYAMQASKGQSIRHFFYRFSGTLIGASMAIVSFYAANDHAAGELAWYFVFMHVPIYIMLKQPRIQTTGTVTGFALTIVLGNKLDLQKFGNAKAEQLGLAVQPIWLIGLIRVASIGGGLLLATIWTLLPYPISETDQVRSNVAACLNLVAKYYTSTYLATRYRLKGGSRGEVNLAMDEIRLLERARHSVKMDIDGRLVSMASQLGFTKWDVQIHNHFPKAQYDGMHNGLGAIVRSLDIIRLAAVVFVDAVATEEHLASSSWLRNFRHVFDGAEGTSQQAAMLLMVLSNSLNTKTSLPPYLKVLDAYSLSISVDKIDADLLNVRNASEPGLATFAAIQVEIQRIHKHLADLLTIVKELVGELDVELLV